MQERHEAFIAVRNEVKNLLESKLKNMGFTQPISDKRWFNKNDIWVFNCPHMCNTLAIYKNMHPESKVTDLGDLFDKFDQNTKFRTNVGPDSNAEDVVNSFLLRIENYLNEKEDIGTTNEA